METAFRALIFLTGVGSLAVSDESEKPPEFKITTKRKEDVVEVTENHTNTLGVMYKAIIVTPNEDERRIVNSTMQVTEGDDEISADKQEEFVTTDKISQKNY